MKNNIQNVATAVSLFFVASATLGCNEWQGVSGTVGGGVTSWGFEDETSIDGVDSALVEQFKYSFKDGGDLSVILWTDVGSGGGISTSGVEQDGQTFVQQGYVYWDEDEKMRCSFAIRMRSNGQHTVEIVGSEYDLSDGATILVKNRGGKVTAEVKQIAGCDLDNAHNVAVENKEILDFYSDKQHPEDEQNETPKG